MFVSLLTLLSATALSPQTAAPSPIASVVSAPPRVVLDGVELREPVATVSPIGWLEVAAKGDAGFVGLALRFPPLEWPPAGEHELSDTGVRAWWSTTAGQQGDAVRGKLTVREFTWQKVDFTLHFTHGDKQRVAEVVLPAALYVPKLTPTVGAEVNAPADQPNHDDVVFCAFGNGGTGLPGQRQVAEAVATLAPTGPLDFVMLLGNNLMPRGVTSERDPLFATLFEDVYDKRRLNVPFYALEGPAEARGVFGSGVKYSTMNQRWASRPTGFQVDFTCRGKRLTVYGSDSHWLAGEVADSRTRTTLRGTFDLMRHCKSEWKVVCTYDQLLSLGGRNESPRTKLLDERSRVHLESAGVDLLLCADGRGMRYVVPDKGIPQLLSGGGGGPEMGGVVETVPGTKFAYGGGGFAWLRFDGTRLQISFRDAAGKVLAVHELTKP